MSGLGYSREGDTVALRMSVDDYVHLLYCLGFVAGAAEANSKVFWSLIALVNRLNAGNPSFTPYEIPEEFR